MTTTREPVPGIDHCTCPDGQRCSCGFAAALSAIFFPPAEHAS